MRSRTGEEQRREEVCVGVCVSNRQGEIERLRWNDSVRVDTVLPIRCLFTFLEWLKRERLKVLLVNIWNVLCD